MSHHAIKCPASVLPHKLPCQPGENRASSEGSGWAVTPPYHFCLPLGPMAVWTGYSLLPYPHTESQDSDIFLKNYISDLFLLLSMRKEYKNYLHRLFN